MRFVTIASIIILNGIEPVLFVMIGLYSEHDASFCG